MRFFTLPAPIDVQTEDDFQEFIQTLQARPKTWEGRIALDTETAKGISIVDNHVVVWSVSDGENRWQLWPEHLWHPSFIALWEDPEIYWVMQNAKFDMHQLHLMGLPELGGKPIDTISMGFLHDENGSSLGMEEMAAKYLGVKMKKFQTVFGKVKKGQTSEEVMLNAPPGTLLEYSTEDAYITWHLSERISEELVDIPFYDRCEHFHNAFDYLVRVESPFTKCLWRMERRGISVDVDKIYEYKESLEEEINDLEADMLREVGDPSINLNSPKQLSHYFFDVLKLKPKGKPTSTGKPALNKDTLPLYAESGVKIAKLLLEYRKRTKILSTYVLGTFIRDRTPEDRVHCRFNQHGTVTGRLSSSNPNLQNIPKVYECREIFIPDEGYSLGCYDYGQLELRILGHFSGDDNLNIAFTTGRDLHAHTASLMLGCSYDEIKAAKLWDDVKVPKEERLAVCIDLLGDAAIAITEEWDRDPSGMNALIDARSAAKTINFGILYGMSPNKLSKTLDISKEQAQEYMDGWFASYPQAAAFIRQQVVEAEETVYHEVRSIQGRYRRLPRITSKDWGTRSREERLAVNSSIQGSGGDIAKMAMIWLDRHPLLGGDSLYGGEYGVELLLQVHDEIVVQCPDEYRDVVDDMIREGMASPPFIDITVPLTVDGGFARHWGDAK